MSQERSIARPRAPRTPDTVYVCQYGVPYLVEGTQELDWYDSDYRPRIALADAVADFNHMRHTQDYLRIVERIVTETVVTPEELL